MLIQIKRASIRETKNNGFASFKVFIKKKEEKKCWAGGLFTLDFAVFDRV